MFIPVCWSACVKNSRQTKTEGLCVTVHMASTNTHTQTLSSDTNCTTRCFNYTGSRPVTFFCLFMMCCSQIHLKQPSGGKSRAVVSQEFKPLVWEKHSVSVKTDYQNKNKCSCNNFKYRTPI